MKAPHNPFRALPIARLLVASCVGSTCLLHAGTVTTATDDPTPGSGSLRTVLAAAANGETINFDTALDGATITLVNGQLAVSGLEVTIDASALPSGIAVSGNNASRILKIDTGSNVTIRNLTFQNGRESAGSSGAIQAQGGQLTMTRCVVKDCLSRDNGGGLYLGNGIVASLDRCTITRNEGQAFGGGLFIIGTTTVTITNTAITGNRSLSGGGIFALSGGPALTNCTVQGNAGEGFRGELTSSFFVRNSIIWGNRSGAGSVASQQIRLGPNASANVDYSLLEATPATLNNLDGTLSANDPKFASPAVSANAPNSSSDVRLLANSTSINAGNNTAISLPLDLAGLPRLQEGNVDLGAFEGGYVTFSALHPLLLADGDENTNGISNYLEYALGLDPAAGGAFSALPSLSSSGGFNILTCSQRINGLDVNATLITSTTLAALSWQPMVSGVDYLLNSSATVAPGRQELVLTLLGNDPARFYRQRFSPAN